MSIVTFGRNSSAAATVLGQHKRFGRRMRTAQPIWAGWGFIGPFMLAFLFTLVAPVIYAIYLSAYQTKLIGGTSFVGFANYREAFHDPQFHTALWHVVLLFFVQVPIMLALSTVAALALDSARLHSSTLFRISLFVPYAVPSVVAALMWGFVYGVNFGLVHDVNSFLGIHLPDPLTSNYVLAALGNIITWEFTGFNMIILYSALTTVPRDRYEAAQIDGAGAFQIIRAIKLPAMRPAFVVTLVFSLIGSFQLFSEPNVLKSLAPNSITSGFTPNMYAYNLSFNGQEFNYAAAIAIAMGIITMFAVYVVQVIGMRKERS
jgi:multiple sugar transport system permease protein